MSRFDSPVFAAYAALAAAGLVAGLALGRVEPVALAAPFALAVLAGAVLGHDPQISGRLTLDRERAVEGDTVVLSAELTSAAGADRLDLVLPLPDELSAEDGAVVALSLRPGETRTLELRLRCERWGAPRVGPLLFRAGDLLGLRSWHGELGEPWLLRVYPSEETLRSLVPPLETQVFAGNRSHARAVRGSSSPTCGSGIAATG